MKSNLKKRCICFFLILVSIFPSFSALARPLTEQDIPVTRNLLGTPLPTRSQYLAEHPLRDLTVHGIHSINNRRDEDGTVIIAVNHRLLNEHEALFDQFSNDIANQGYDVIQLDVEGGTAEEFKELLIDEGGDDLVGAILAGELPLAWFEQYEYFNDEQEPDYDFLIEYPIDLFFMDIDGTWQDTSHNGIYDIHENDNWEPDIWLGRLPAWNLSRIDEDALIAAYLERVHDYRIGRLTLPHRGLNFIDDDWMYYANEWENDLRYSFRGTLTVAHAESTNADNYTRELESEGYEIVQVAVHSTPDTHIFKINNHSANDYFRFSRLRDNVTPNIMFYNLFACSNMNLGSNLCMGALYALRGPYGLGAVGSAKTGSMLYFDDYYQPLADGLCFGDAFKHWFTEHGHQPERENWARSWFYGMTYFGDPTLKVKLGLRLEECIILDDENGDSDNIADTGETVELWLTVSNRNIESIENIQITLTSEDPNIEIQEGEGYINSINGGGSENAQDFFVSINDDCPDGHNAVINLMMTPENDTPWHDRIILEIRSPVIEITRFDNVGAHGIWTGPGEEGQLILALKNIGGDDLQEGGNIEFISTNATFAFPDGEPAAPVIIADSSVWYGADEYILYRIDDDLEQGEGVLVRMNIFKDEALLGEGLLLLPTSSEFNFQDDLNQEPDWLRSYAVTNGYSNAWQWKDDGGDGSGGLCFTGEDSLGYPARSDGVFELPLMMLNDGARLNIHHRMYAEQDFDGARVELNTGNGWRLIEPDDGYNGIAVANGSFEGGRCWNGTFNWRDDIFVISERSGSIRLRFRFVSDNGIEDQGWFINALNITGSPFIVSETEKLPEITQLISLYPNPFNSFLHLKYSLADPSEVTITLFDLTGRKVAEVFENKLDAGIHEVVFQAINLPAGIYLLNFKTKEGIIQKKISLIK
ncbi:T9SS type A sorting domain-containing protein [bacterium]|nr:T9SS type A sorting domain-containing protein [bacterium]